MLRSNVLHILEVKSHGDEEYNRLELELSYTKGRGYYMSAQPYKVEGNCRSFMAYSGVRVLVQSSNRFSAKTLESLGTTADVKEWCSRLTNTVVRDQKLEVIGDVPFPFINYKPEVADETQ